MYRIATMEVSDVREVHNQLLARHARGRIGKGRYFDGARPCCLLGHAIDIMGYDDLDAMAKDFDETTTFPDEGDFGVIIYFNDNRSQTSAIKMFIELLTRRVIYAKMVRETADGQ